MVSTSPLSSGQVGPLPELRRQLAQERRGRLSEVAAGLRAPRAQRIANQPVRSRGQVAIHQTQFG